jgi:hypothetical protein
MPGSRHTDEGIIDPNEKVVSGGPANSAARQGPCRPFGYNPVEPKTGLRVAARGRHSRHARLTLAGDDLRLAEALCYRGRQLDGARIDQGGRPEIRNVAEADPGFGVGAPQRPFVARVAE